MSDGGHDDDQNTYHGDVDGDLGSDIMSDIFASAEYRRAMAAIELKHAIFHATGLAHH